MEILAGQTERRTCNGRAGAGDVQSTEHLATRHRQEIEIEIEPPQRALHHALLSSSVRFGLRRYCQCLGIGVGINERIIKAIDVSANQSTFDC